MTISWAELVVLMGFGDGREDRLAGTIRVRDVQEIWEGADPEEFDGAVESHPSLGQVVVRETVSRIERRGELVRVSRPDGTVTAIFGADSVWLFDGDVPTVHDARNSLFGSAGADLIRRLPPSRWEGTDFTRLTGPIESTEFLGRPAWAFELAPPSHKPFPLQMIVDAATGIVLRHANRDFGSVSEWTSLDTDVDLPDELFEWDGPARPAEDERAEREAEWQAEQQDAEAWLVARGVVLELPVRPTLHLHERSDETGELHLSFDATVHGSLLRRPLADGVDESELHYPHMYRWRDERWEWLLGSGDPLTDDQLDALKARLGESE